jgi:phosphoadenosine phosphosulfate reductase
MALSVGETLDLDAINEQLADKTPEQIVGWAVDNFDEDKIYSLTSAGLSAPLTLDLLHRTAKAGISPRIPVIHNDTGFLPDQVHEYLHGSLVDAFGFELIPSGPSEETIRFIEDAEFWNEDTAKYQKLWDHDKPEYRRLTKLDPLGTKLGELGVQVLITGVRNDQTDNRGDLDIVTNGADGEIRVNPNFWTPARQVEERLEAMIAGNHSLRHPLYLVVDYIDDWQFVGGPKEECGINLASRFIQAPTASAQATA